MRTMRVLALLGVLLVAAGHSFAQTSNDAFTFDCGTITPNGSGISTYRDFEHGFRFQLPTGWVGGYGGYGGLGRQGSPGTIFVEAFFDTKNAQQELAKGTTATGGERANGLDWAALKFTDIRNGSEGYSLERNGMVIQVVAAPVGAKNNTVPPATADALKQILSTFTFTDEPYRLDRQLAALRTGDKLGNLTVKRVVRGAGGFEHPYATIEFNGQLTLSGGVVLPSPSMLGGWLPYSMYLDDASRSLLPQLKCPVEGLAERQGWKYQIGFSNQQFTNQQFAQVPSISGNHSWYEAEATVVVDEVTAKFADAAMTPEVSARLMKVISKKEGP